MIISASRRTDIPAFYSEWFINRVRAGYCTVPNPFNRNQVAYVSLRPEDVDVIVFWTRNPRPLFPYLDELNERGYRYYFQFTVMDNPREIDTKTPALATSLKSFQQLADAIGPDKVVWRYDPIVFSELTGAQFHANTYRQIAKTLKGYTRRSVISILDIYPKVQKRLHDLANHGINIIEYSGTPSPRFEELIKTVVKAAKENGMEIFSCAEVIDLRPFGVHPGKCIDDDLIEKAFQLRAVSPKDPSQRDACGCIVSKDIGMYDTCLFGCQYCYATRSFQLAKANNEEHDPSSPSLTGWYEANPVSESFQMGFFKEDL